MKPSSNSESPASSTGAPVRSRQKTVPISRNSGSGYERPERARTSHACEPCRERKTKCDGERPSCRRCLHTGTGCHYGYGKGWKKRKTAEDLTVTSKRLARYESLLNEIMPMVGPEVRAMIEDARHQQEMTTPGPGDLTDSGTPLSSHGVDGDFRSTSPSISRLPLPMPGMTSQPAIFAQQSRSLPPPLTTDHNQQQTLRKSPTEDSANGAAFRLPSITRHGVLLEDGSREGAAISHVSSAPEPLMTMNQHSPNSIHQVLSDAPSSQGGSSFGTRSAEANADTRRIIQESFSRLNDTVGREACVDTGNLTQNYPSHSPYASAVAYS